jgi:hypothetical protein
MKHAKFRITAAVFLPALLWLASSVSAQQFTQESTRGRTEMQQPGNVIDIPAIDVQIREPESGREVAFSIQLMQIERESELPWLTSICNPVLEEISGIY